MNGHTDLQARALCLTRTVPKPNEGHPKDPLPIAKDRKRIAKHRGDLCLRKQPPQPLVLSTAQKRIAFPSRAEKQLVGLKITIYYYTRACG